MKEKLCFIGGGNMAQAIVFGLLKQGYPAENITVCDPNAPKLALFAERGVQVSSENITAVQNADVVVLAVKPQVAADVCQPLSAVDFRGKLVISIMAAISVEKLTALLPSATDIVRVMPNTPALVSEGMSGLFARENVSTAFKQVAENLMSAVGKILWVENEQDMHSVTAGSGSSPAYFFYFMEAMQKALMNMNLTEEQARLLVQQSALGAAKMVVENPQLALSTLRENVTSKGGTTAAALTTFQENNLDNIVEQGMKACVNRSQEMEKLF